MMHLISKRLTLVRADGVRGTESHVHKQSDLSTCLVEVLLGSPDSNFEIPSPTYYSQRENVEFRTQTCCSVGTFPQAYGSAKIHPTQKHCLVQCGQTMDCTVPLPHLMIAHP